MSPLSPQPTPKAGALFVFQLPFEQRFGAFQVLAVDEEKQRILIAVLNWFGDTLPSPQSLRGVEILEKNFMFWQHQPLVQYVPLPVPSRFARIGGRPITESPECRTYGGWDFDRIAALQLRWLNLPRAVRQEFDRAKASTEQVEIPGLVNSDGSPYSQSIANAKQFRDNAGYRVTSDFQLTNLTRWPLLYQVELSSWRSDLVPFLERSPIVSELTLRTHGQRELDFSTTHLQRLSVDITGLSQLSLPPRLEALALTGSASAALNVSANSGGQWITLRTQSHLVPVRGLEKVRKLRIDRIHELRLDQLAAIHPKLEFLDLCGAPGTVRYLDGLSRLSRLESLRMVDLFGYHPEDFPVDLPALQSLDLESLPGEVAKRVRKEFRGTGVELTVRKPRKPEWLAENLENPLRHWDGAEGIPASVAKRARIAFVSALRSIRAADIAQAGATSASTDRVILEAVREFLAVIRAADERHEFLYSLERDQVVEAVRVLAAKASPVCALEVDRELDSALG